MVVPAAAAVTITALMTLRSDTKPVTVYVKSPKGTIFWGGAGLDGDYILPVLNALRHTGIRNVSVGLTNTATRNLPKNVGIVGTLVDAIRAGLVIKYEDDDEWVIGSGMSEGEQFNLIGYSYGSLLEAQTANFYAKKNVVVDNLVLIASPIDSDFLNHLRSSININKVSVIDIRGDDIHAGMSQIELMSPGVLKKLSEDMQANKGRGHFYYAHLVPDLDERLKILAHQIFSMGVR